MRATGNQLLDLLPQEALDRLRPHLAAEPLRLNETLQRRGKPLQSVFFPT